MAKITDIPHRMINAGGVASAVNIHVYEAGTSTRVTLYSDEGLTNQVSNPYNVASTNSVPTLYHSDIGDVRVEVIDASGSIFDDDPYDAPIGKADLTSADSDKGASLVGFAQSGNNISLRTVATKLREQPVSIEDFSGTTVARLKSAAAELQSRGGGTLLIPRGLYELASTELATPIILSDNVTVEGEGSALTVIGEGIISSIFRSTNGSNLTIRNLLVLGNGQAVADSASGAFLNYLHDDAGNGAENIRIENIRLANFKAERWISLLNTNDEGKTVRGVRLRDVSVVSQSGNNLGGDNIAIHANAIMVFGVHSPIVDVEVDGFYAEADYIKCGICIFHKVQNVRIRSPRILRAGQGGTSDDKGAYAINIYGDPGELCNVTIDDPVITAPRSCGIYLRCPDHVTINNAQISGQTDTITATLPKGAIATNGATKVKINGGLFKDNAFHAMYVALTGSSTFDIEMNGCKLTGSGAGVVLNATSGTGAPDGARFIHCDVSVSGRAMQHLNEFRAVKNLVVDGGRWISTGNSAFELNPYDGGALAGYRIRNIVVGATNRGIDIDSPAATVTGDVVIDNVVIYDTGPSALDYGIIARHFPALNISNTLIRDMGTGYATLTTGAKGTICDLRILNVANGHHSTSLGMVAPTGSAETGDFVQNLAPAEAGATPNKYINTGWRYASGWLEQRTLTGN